MIERTLDDNFVIHCGDAVSVLESLPSESVDCCITSPPYYGLRDYGVDGQIGLEETPEQYIDRLVAVFREVRRVLRDDGTLWVNIGDSYASDTKGSGGTKISESLAQRKSPEGAARSLARQGGFLHKIKHGLKTKDLIGIPWMLAFALRADGWYLRSEIIWHKPNPMPESVKDRPTKAHEQIFLLSKSPKYYYDADAIREPFADERMGNPGGGGAYSVGSGRNDSDELKTGEWERGKDLGGRNKRSVWTITPKPFKGAHFAVFPPKLPQTCMLAGCPEGGVVLDPFSGAGHNWHRCRSEWPEIHRD